MITPLSRLITPLHQHLFAGLIYIFLILILEVDGSGNLIRGFGSTYSVDTDFYPLSAVYNPTTKVLTVVFTKPAVVAPDGQAKMYFTLGSSSIYLSTSDEILKNNVAANKVLEIALDDDTAVRLVTANSDNLAINFDSGAFTDDLKIPTSMSSSNNPIYSAENGFVCFVGDFTYIDNISHPVFVQETSDGNWIFGNSSKFYVTKDKSIEEERTVSDVVEIDPDDAYGVDDKLISSDIKFSDFSS